MTASRWSNPIEIELGSIGQARIVATAYDAADCLLNKWPSEGGPAHLAARKACIDALDGKKPPDHARNAFINACKEADIHIRSK